MADAPISVFISYSRKDSAFVDRLEADLRAYGFTTWVDRQHLEGGADWARVIEQRILDHEAFIVALSPDANLSDWVRREIIFAQNAGRHIIPVIVSSVTTAPIEIIEKQRIDLSASYADGLQDLRIALLKTLDLPQPPKPAQAPQPLLAPDLSDPLKGLVEIPPAPPAPDPDLNATFMQAQAALAHGSLDLAEALLRQIVEKDPHFGNDLATEELDRVRKQLEPIQIDRLQRMASEAHARGAWGEEIGALRALTDHLLDNESIRDRLEIAEECQKWAWLYDNARAFAEARDVASTSAALTRLWEKAPNYGDPARIAPPGLKLPAPGTTPAAQRYASLALGHTIVRFIAHNGSISALRWSPDGSRLATADAPRIRAALAGGVISGAAGGVVGGVEHGIASHLPGRHSITQAAPEEQMSPKARMSIWDPRDGRNVLSYRAYTQPVYDIAWMPDGRTIVSTDGALVRLWQANSEMVIFTLHPDASNVSAVYTSPNGSESLGGAGSSTKTSDTIEFFTWNAKTGAQTERWGLSGYQNANAKLSPNGRWIVVYHGNDVHKGHHVYVVSAGAHKIEADHYIGGGAVITDVDWNPDSTRLLVGCQDYTVRVLQPQSGDWSGATAGARVRSWFDPPVAITSSAIIESLSCGGHAGSVTAVAWSPDGVRLASACSDGVRIWNAANGQLLYNYSEHKANVTAIAFSPDSSRVASGDANGQVHIWKA